MAEETEYNPLLTLIFWGTIAVVGMGYLFAYDFPPFDTFILGFLYHVFLIFPSFK